MSTDVQQVVAATADIPAGESEGTAPLPESDVAPVSPLAGLDEAALDDLPEVKARIERARAEASREAEQAVVEARRSTEAEVGERHRAELRQWSVQRQYADQLEQLAKESLTSGEDLSRPGIQEIVGRLYMDAGSLFDESYGEYMLSSLPKDYRIPASTQKAIDGARRALVLREPNARVDLWSAITNAAAEAKSEVITAGLRAEVEKEVRAEMETTRLKEAEAARAKAGSPTRTGDVSPSGFVTYAAAAAARNAGEITAEQFRTERARFGVEVKGASR